METIIYFPVKEIKTEIADYNNLCGYVMLDIENQLNVLIAFLVDRLDVWLGEEREDYFRYAKELDTHLGILLCPDLLSSIFHALKSYIQFATGMKTDVSNNEFALEPELKLEGCGVYVMHDTCLIKAYLPG